MEEAGFGKKVWRYIWPLLIIWAAVVVLAALSFLVLKGEFTWSAYSNRLFWGGIAVVLVGGFAVVSVLGSLNTMGTPSVITAPGDARIAHEKIGEYLKTNSRRYGFSFRMFIVGALCIGTSALVEVLSR